MLRRLRFPYKKIAAEILPGWEVSLALVTPAIARRANKTLRGKNYVPNVLSYQIAEKSGEIILCPDEIARQTSSFQLPASSLQLLCFIHALLHLKGWAHGARMERCEQKLLLKYGAANSNRHRHRHVPGQSGRRRRTR